MQNKLILYYRIHTTFIGWKPKIYNRSFLKNKAINMQKKFFFFLNIFKFYFDKISAKHSDKIFSLFNNIFKISCQ